MNTIVPEMNEYSDERYESLFQDLFETFDELGLPRLSGPVDALTESEDGNGNWGVLVSDAGELGFWMLADGGTICFYANGNVEYIDVDLEDDYVIRDNESMYDHAHRVMSIFIPEEDMPEHIPGDDVEEAAADLSQKADIPENLSEDDE